MSGPISDTTRQASGWLEVVQRCDESLARPLEGVTDLSARKGTPHRAGRVPSRFVWRIGKRNQETADAYVTDLRARLVVMPAMTRDRFSCYKSAERRGRRGQRASEAMPIT